MSSNNNLPQSEQSASFLDAVEKFSGRVFRYRREIEYIFLRAEQSRHAIVLEELLFTAKFVSNAHAVLKRVGVGSDGTDKLLLEYSKNLKRSGELLRSFFPASQDAISKIIQTELLEQSESGMEKLLDFLYEVSWIKNYLMDTKR
jgi:hypothetical protein